MWDSKGRNCRQRWGLPWAASSSNQGAWIGRTESWREDQHEPQGVSSASADAHRQDEWSNREGEGNSKDKGCIWEWIWQAEGSLPPTNRASHSVEQCSRREREAAPEGNQGHEAWESRSHRRSQVKVWIGNQRALGQEQRHGWIDLRIGDIVEGRRAESPPRQTGMEEPRAKPPQTRPKAEDR